MKKIFTLVAGMLLTAAVFAADRKPVVTLNNNKNYKIVIDGRIYFGDNMTIRLDDFFRKRHTIKVYEIKRGFFGRTEKMVDAATFLLERNDMAINIDRFGNIMIREIRDHGCYDKDDRFEQHENGNNRKDDHYKKDGRNKRY